MQKQPVQIIIIDDDPHMGTRPIFVKLCQAYGKENVIWKENPNDGLTYVKEHLTRRTIIILDYDFGGKVNCIDLFQELQGVSSLLYFIVSTAKQIEDIPRKDLKAFINNHLMALGDKTDGYHATLKQVEKAIDYLNSRVDCILEEWILRHERFKRETPYMTVDGTAYSLEDILNEIRKDTAFGKKMTSNIISTAITMMQRDIDKIK